MSQQPQMGEPEFVSPRAIREYCEKARKVLRPLYFELAFSADELELVLRDHPSVSPRMGGLDSKVRARLVASHMKRAAEGLEVASASMVRSFTSYRKHYLEPMQAAQPRQRRQFDVTDQ